MVDQKLKNQNPEKHSNFKFGALKSSKKTQKIFDLGLACQKNIFFSKTQNHIKSPEKCLKRVFNGF